MMVPARFPDSPFTWPQARALGVTRRQLDAAVSERRVTRLLLGVYARSDIPLTKHVRAQAAAIVTNPFMVLCDRTAAWLHEVDTFEYRELEVPPPLETYVLRGHNRVTRAGCSGGARDLAPRDICTIGDVRLTTMLRTALDLGCKLSRRDALAVLDAFMRLGVTCDEMEAELSRYFRRRGVIQLRQLVPLADPRAESPGESWTRLEIVDAGLPTPEPQFWVLIDDVPTYRLDLAYPKSRVCVEYDGQEFHNKRKKQRDRDRKRRKWLRDHGWTVIVLTKDSFTAEAIGAWMDELRVALRIRR
jgi:hypothetical protein